MSCRRSAPPLARAFAVAALLAATACGQASLTWTGVVSGDWNDAANWSPMQTPTAIDDVSVPKVEFVVGVVPLQPTISDATAVCRNLATSGSTTGGILRLTPAGVLSISGDANLNGKVSSTVFGSYGELRFVGSAASVLATAATTRDCSLAVDKAGGSLFSSSTIDFSGSISVLAGAVTFVGDVSFSGTGTFSGGSFSGPSGLSSLFVFGDVAFSGTSVTNPLNLAAGSDLATDAAFAPTGGSVLLSGLGSDPAARMLTGSGSFFDLDLAGSGPVSLVGAVVARNVSVTVTTVTLAAGAVLSIGGNLVVASGSLVSGDAAAIFDVAGSVQIAGGAAITGVFSANVAGNWSSAAAFAPTGGRVRFDGAAQTVSDAGSFFDVEVAASGTVAFGATTATGDLTVLSGTCEIGAGLTFVVGGDLVLSGGAAHVANAAARFDVAGDVHVDGGGPLTLLNVDVAGDWTATASIVYGAGRVRFDGVGAQAVTGPAVFFDVLVAGGDVTFDAATVGGAFDLTSGSATAAAGAVVAVAGNATFSGGSVASADAAATFDVAGDATFSGAAASAILNLDVAGSWNATAAFAPTASTVRFDGAAPQTVAGAGVFRDVVVASTDVVSLGAATIAGDLTATSGVGEVGAGLTATVGGDVVLNGGVLRSADAAAKFDVAGDVRVDGGGPLTLLNFDVAGDWTATAAIIYGAGLVRFDGAGPQAITGPVVFADVEVAGGDATFASTSVGGSFTLSSGSATVAAGAVVSVAGDATFSGGAVSSADAAAKFDVAGAATFSGATASGLLNLDVAGDWSATAAFAPTDSLVRFDGAAPQSVTGAGVFRDVAGASTGGGVAFAPAAAVRDLSVTSGTFTVVGAAVLDVNGDLLVALGATLVLGVGGATLAGDVDLDGTLTTAGPVVFDGGNATATGATYPPFSVAKPGATLTFGPATVGGAVAVQQGTLAAAGPLTVVGAFTVAAPAAFLGGAFTHEFRASFAADGPAGGSGVFVFAPPAVGGLFPPTVPARNAAPFPNVVVAAAPGRTVAFAQAGPAAFGGTFTAASGNAAFLGTTTLADDVSVAGGTILVLGAVSAAQDWTQISGATVAVAGATVAGSAAFSGGSFVANALFDVADDVVFNGATTSGVAQVRCGGDWTSGGLFNPTGGAVVLTGSGPRFVFGAPIFHDFIVESGASITTLASVRVKHAAVVRGTLTAAATFVSDASFLVPAGGLFDGVAGLHRFGGAFSAAAGGLAFLPGARVRFDGALPAAPAAADVLPEVEVAKTGGATLTWANLAVGADLLLASGRLLVGAGATVAGSLLATGGTFAALDPASPLVVAGDAQFAATTAEVVALSVAGDFASDATFLPTGGRVVLAGAGPHAVLGACDFGAAGLELADGVTTPQTPVRVGGAFLVAAPATFAAVAGVHLFGGDVTCLGTLGVDGTYALDGAASATVASVAPFPALVAQKTGGAVATVGAAGVAATTVVGALTQTSGGLVVGAGTTLDVLGDATFSGGTFATAAGAVLDVAGSLDASGATVAGAAEIRVGSNFVGGAGFAPSAGTLTFDGGGTSQATRNGAILRDLRVDAGTTTDVQGLVGLLVAGTTSVGGVLQSGVTSSFRGPFAVDVGGSFDGGDQPHLFGDDVLSFGQMIHVLPLTADGSAAAELGGGIFQSTCVVAKSGTGSAQLGGTLPFSVPSLTVQSGFAFVPASTVAVVNGPATFLGGAFASANVAATLDVAGDVVFAGTVADGIASLDVGGSFTADAAFAPTSGRVRLDAAAGAVVAAAAPGGTLAFPELIVATNAASFASDAVVAADAITVAAGAVLRIAGATVRVGPTTWSVAGEIFVDAGGRLELDDAAPLVVPVGATLRLAGTPTAPAVLAGVGPAGASVRVEGALAARNFAILDPAVQGFVLDLTATLAAAPDDFRGGLLSGPRAGGVLLDVRRAAAGGATTDFRYLTFENPLAAAGAANVRSPFGTPISFTNFAGAFGGETFDDDPQNRVTWGPTVAPTILAFMAAPGVGVVSVTWVAGQEPDVEAYVVERREPPAPVFDFVAEVAVGGLYQVADFTVNPSTSYEYRLSARLTHGAVVPLAVAPAQTLLLLAGATNVFDVGPDRAFLTPQAAIDAALASGGARPLVRLAPGTYPSFTIASPPAALLRLVADGAGPVVLDASAAPVRLENVAVGRGVAFYGLVIDAGGASHPALDLDHVSSPTIVDACVVLGGTGPAVRASASVGLAVQRSTLAGAPGLALTAGAAASIAGGVTSGVDLVGTSLLRASGADLGAVAVGASATFVPYTGPAALLDLPPTALLGGPCHVRLDAGPGRPWLLAASLALSYLPPLSPVEMPVLIDLPSTALLATGVTDGAGASSLPLVVPPLPALLGLTIWLQGAVFDPTAGTFRLTSVAGVSITG